MNIKGPSQVPLSERPQTPSRIEPKIDRSKVDPGTRAAAEGMEAMFLDYMMQVMRNTVPDNEMDMEGPATKIYRSMMDSQMAQNAARTGGVGLSEQIIAYLESARYNEQRRTESPEVVSSTGGTHESVTNSK